MYFNKNVQVRAYVYLPEQHLHCKPMSSATNGKGLQFADNGGFKKEPVPKKNTHFQLTDVWQNKARLEMTRQRLIT